MQGEYHVKTEAEIGVMQLRAKECQQHQTLRERRGTGQLSFCRSVMAATGSCPTRLSGTDLAHSRCSVQVCGMDKYERAIL